MGRVPRTGHDAFLLIREDRRAGGGAARSLYGLDWLNFFVADFQTGFGPFIAVYLTSVGWTQGAIGGVLSVGTVAAMASQVPAGALVDAVGNKRGIATAAILAIAASALAIAAWPVFLPIVVAEALHALASAVLNPAIAAISLSLVERNALGERLGRNARYAAIGNALAAGLMGACGYYLSDRAVFMLTAVLALAALGAVAAIRPQDIRPLAGVARSPQPQPWRRLWRMLDDRRLIVFCGCAGLFQFANAAMLPIAAGMVTERAGTGATLLIAGGMIGPQLLTALLSPQAGRAAERWGRRPVLCLGFAALPVRGLLFAEISDPHLFILIQLLDGVGAAVFGVLLPLIVADVTGDSGHYTLALGIVGLAVGTGATLSTGTAGLVADWLGGSAAFLVLAAIGAGSILLVATLMPETRPAPAGTPGCRTGRHE
jgi:MFS family permease